MAVPAEDYSLSACTRDYRYRELLKKEDRCRKWWEYRWGWYWKEQQKMTDDMISIYEENRETIQDKSDSFQVTKISEKVYPHVADAGLMHNWPAFPQTSNAQFGRFAMRPLEAGGAVVSRPNVFSYKFR